MAANIDWVRHSRRLLKITPAPGVTAEDLAAALGQATVRTLNKDEVLCWEGSAGDAMYILLRGTMSVQREEPGSSTLRELVRVGAPSIAGHMALIDGSKRSATCVAIDELTVAELGAVQVRQLIDENSPRGLALRRLLITTLATQLTGANRRIAHLAAASRPDQILDPADLDKQNEKDTQEVLRIAGMLEGWSGSMKELDEVEWVPQVHRKDLKGRR